MSKNPAVRVSHFERSLEGFNEEIGRKTGLLIQRYHADYVEPRLARLEAERALWRKALDRIRQWRAR